MFKKCASLASVLALLLSVLLLVPTSVSAAQALTIEDDFISYTDGDIGKLSMAKYFAMESGDHVRIKYAFGKGYCCPDGGGVTSSIVYKVDANGGTFDSLNITVKAHFASREGYNADWTSTPHAIVSVSTDGTKYEEAAIWDGERVSKTDYPNDTDYKNLPVKTYNADLKAAAGSNSVLYVKLSWNVFDFPLYSSVHNVKIEGTVSGGAGISQATTTTTTAATTTTTTTTAAAPTEATTTAPSAGDTTTASSADAGTTTAPTSGDVAGTTTAPSEDNDANTGNDDGGDGNGAPIGLIVGIVVVLILVAGGAIVFLMYKKTAKK